MVDTCGWGGGGGGGDWTSVIFCVAVVQVVPLCGSEMLVMSPCIYRALGCSYHRLVRMFMGIHPSIRTDGTWLYPPLTEAMAEAMAEVVLYELET